MPKKPVNETFKKGPEPERLKLEGSWQDAIKTTLKKKKPPGGWPKEKPERLPE